jgi:hypothetical protein
MVRSHLFSFVRQLRNCGIYRLPDGYLYVVVRGGTGKFYLFDYSTLTKARPVFEVTADGRVARRFGSGPEWRVEQLEDTGQTYDDPHDLKCPE